MLRLLTRTRRLALLAAGLLGLAPLGAAEPIARSVAARPVVAPGRMKEMQIELGWMADPATFRCPLRVRVNGPKIEVAGSVPDEKTKSRALQIAYDIASIPVLDTTTMGRLAGPDYTPTANDQLTRDVTRALDEVFGPRSRHFEIGVRGDGRVTLKGTAHSHEDKHAIGVRLRHVSGCSCVVNQIEVTAPAPESKTAKPVVTTTPKPMQPAAEDVSSVPSPKVTAPPVKPRNSPYQTKPATVMPKATTRPTSGVERASAESTPYGNQGKGIEQVQAVSRPEAIAASTNARTPPTIQSPYSTTSATPTKTPAPQPLHSPWSSVKSTAPAATQPSPIENKFPKAEKLPLIEETRVAPVKPVEKEPAVAKTTSSPKPTAPKTVTLPPEKKQPASVVKAPVAGPLPRKEPQSRSLREGQTKSSAAIKESAVVTSISPSDHSPLSKPTSSGFEGVKAFRTTPKHAASTPTRTIMVASGIPETSIQPAPHPQPKPLPAASEVMPVTRREVVKPPSRPGKIETKTAEPAALPKSAEPPARSTAIATRVKEPVAPTKTEVTPPPVPTPKKLFNRLARREPKADSPQGEVVVTEVIDRPTLPDRPYVTMGIAVFPVESPAPETKKGTKAAPTPVSLSLELVRGKVIRAGGVAVLDADVREKPDGGMSIKVCVKDAASVDSTLARIRQLDEIKAANVDLSFQVGR